MIAAKVLQIVFVLLIGIGSVASQDKWTTGPLRLTVELSNVEICIGESMEIPATLTNVSKSAVAVDPNWIGKILMFRKLTSAGSIDLKNSFSITRKDPTGYKPKRLMLKPGEKVDRKVDITFSSDSNPQEGRYEVVVRYLAWSYRDKRERIDLWEGTIYSEITIVYLKNCKGL